jgi:hypothetical protein
VCTRFQVTISGSLQAQCHGACISGHHYLQSAELGLSEPRLREGSARSHSIVDTMLKPERRVAGRSSLASHANGTNPITASVSSGGSSRLCLHSLVPAVGRVTGLTEYHKPSRVSWLGRCIMSFDVSRGRPLLFCSSNIVICFSTLLAIGETRLAMYNMWRYQIES